MFLQVCVILFTKGGEYLTRYTPGTRYTPRPGTPPGPGTPPRDQVHPLDQVHPPWDQVHPPPGPGTPPRDQVHPLNQVYPHGIRYTPLPDQVHPPGPGTPPRSTAYWEIRSTCGRSHPTGMQSCISSFPDKRGSADVVKVTPGWIAQYNGDTLASCLAVDSVYLLLCTWLHSSCYNEKS